MPLTKQPHDQYVTIMGKRWHLRYCQVIEPDCDRPDLPRKQIRIPMRLQRTPKKLMDYLIHEALHAADWNQAEYWTHHTAQDITNLLWAQGFRLSKE